MFKVKNKNTGTRCEICSKLTIKIPEQCHGIILVSSLLTLNIFHLWRRSGIFILNFLLIVSEAQSTFFLSHGKGRSCF